MRLLDSANPSPIFGIEVRECGDGHEPVIHRAKDCPACREISKRLTNENALEVKLALAEQKISEMAGTIDALQLQIDRASIAGQEYLFESH